MGVKRWNLVVYFLSDPDMINVNKTVFSRSDSTDVITLPMEGDPLEGEIFLGLDEIKRNSEEYGTDYVWEVKFCVLHGLLHLLGWEDDTEEKREQMLRFQEEFLNRYESGLSPE